MPLQWINWIKARDIKRAIVAVKFTREHNCLLPWSLGSLLTDIIWSKSTTANGRIKSK